jgi:hypothetical protein
MDRDRLKGGPRLEKAAKDAANRIHRVFDISNYLFHFGLLVVIR